MPSYVIKPDRDQDFYVMWSEIVDAPTGWGTRAEFKATPWFKPDEVADERFERADQYGTSARWPGTDPNDQIYGWNDPTLIYKQQGILLRKHLRTAVDLLGDDENADISHLLHPFEDDDLDDQ